MYKCECGKEYENYKAYNGHRGRCRVHLGDEKFDNHTLKVIESRHNNAIKRKSDKINDWYNSSPRCEYCGKLMTEYYGSGRFCNKSCSNGWVSLNQSEESKSAKVIKGRNNLIPGCKSDHLDPSTKKKISDSVKLALSSPDVRHKMSLYQRSKKLSEETRKKISDKNKENYRIGRIKGWPSRNIESYSESFWKSVLENNNIKYVREKVIKKSDLGIEENGCYFLDFYLTEYNIDLEIDGSSHYINDRKLKDAERDIRLSNNGIEVYRIKWINPHKDPISVKNDIDALLNRLNKCDSKINKPE